MQLDWIEDILAVIDQGSLAGAAEQRLLTQSAFTRRVRSIEEKLGTQLFDRARKPVVVRPEVLALEPELREMSARLRRLGQDLRQLDRGGLRAISFACQHAITTTISPRLVQRLTAQGDLSVRVKSGSRDACLMLVLTGEADLAVTYELPNSTATLPAGFEATVITQDRLIPVIAPALADRLPTQDLPTQDLPAHDLPVIGYPADVFFGQVLDRHILPQIGAHHRLVYKAETALTLAACEYALEGIGVAWLPKSLTRAHVQAGLLKVLPELPSQGLSVSLIGLTTADSTLRHEIQSLLDA